MTRMRIRSRALPILLATLLAALVVAGCTSDAGTDDARPAEAAAADQPYAGWEARPIRALDPELVEDLLAGRGAGYALAAELNHYPGPTHVLQMAESLALTTEQHDMIQIIFDTMQAEAQPLGQDLVDLEADLDQQFRDGSIDKPLLQQITADIAVLDGKLRSTHLAAHLDVVALLSQDQVEQYDELRGYDGDHESTGMDHSSHNSSE